MFGFIKKVSFTVLTILSCVYNYNFIEHSSAEYNSVEMYFND